MIKQIISTVIAAILLSFCTIGAVEEAEKLIRKHFPQWPGRRG